MAFDAERDVFSVVLLGKECPLSRCCKMAVCFQFTKDIGGKVICMESLCALNPLQHFFIGLDLVQTLFYESPADQHTTEETLGPAALEDSALATRQETSAREPEPLSQEQFKKMRTTFRK